MKSEAKGTLTFAKFKRVVSLAKNQLEWEEKLDKLGIKIEWTPLDEVIGLYLEMIRDESDVDSWFWDGIRMDEEPEDMWKQLLDDEYWEE